MIIIDNIADWIAFQSTLPAQAILGLVPTMGCLHAGHQRLIQASKKQTTITVVSIFVNPMQFNHAADYKHYPRTLDKDLDHLKQQKVEAAFIPNIDTMFPDNKHYQVVCDHPISTHLEGKYRPGHFNGMLTIVLKLLSLIQPNIAYFGEKDYQQYQLVKGLVQAFFLKTHIEMIPTQRESSQLPLSSRNQRLSRRQKKKADLFARYFHQYNDPKTIKALLNQEKIPFDYVSIDQNRLFAAVFIDDIRLIDNRELTPSPP